MIYTVLLNPAIDRILRVDNFIAGTTIKANTVEVLPLGKAVSVACAVAALGEKVKVVGLMGAYDEPLYNRFVAARNVEHEWVKVNEQVRHNITILDAKNRTTTHIREPGFPVSRETLAELQKRVVKQVKADDWVAFCGSLPPGAGVRTFREMVGACREKKANVLLDTSGRPLVEGIRGKPNCIKPNHAEFEQIFGEEVKGVQHIALKAKGLLDRGLASVFVSMGDDGLIAANSKSLLLARAKTNARPQNTVGCGDSLVAGLLVGFKRGKSFEEVCCLGVACGAANTYVTGPGLIRKSDVDRLCGRVEKVLR